MSEYDDLNLQVTMTGNPEYSEELQGALKEAGFLVESDDRIAPDWEATHGREALEELSAPQLAELVQVAHKDLAKRIAIDVENGMSVEDAYMSRAATDPAATLIAEATVIRNDKSSSLEKQLESFKAAAQVKDTMKEHLNRNNFSPTKKNGLEQFAFYLAKEMKTNPENAQKMLQDYKKTLSKDFGYWKSPEESAKKLAIVAMMNAPDKEPSLKDMSTQEFTAHAAKEYTDKYKSLYNDGKDPQTASTVAVAHIKTLAKKANLRIQFKQIDNKSLMGNSLDTKKIESLLKGNIKPSRLATFSKSKDNENGR